MKKILLSLLSLVLISALYGAQSVDAGSPPAIDVSVVLLDQDEKTTDAFLLDDPITVVISMENVGTDTVIAQEVFLSKQYHLELHFTYTRPDGTKELITADIPHNLDEPGSPRVKLIGGKLRQVEGVVFLESGWAWSVNPFNARDHYRIDLTGYWSVKAVIANRTYLPSALVTYSGKTYGKIPQGYWGGDLESNPANFKIVGDWDNDGYFYPELPPGVTNPPEIDCNDYDSNVNPGREEILNNGIDDDCNSGTLDKVTAEVGTCDIRADKHIVGGGSHPGSNKEPISGLMVKAFDMSAGSCVRTYGVSWHHYENIWSNCTTPFACITGGDGKRSLDLPPGDYVLIAKYDPDVLELPGSDTDNPDNDIYIGVSAGDIQSGETTQKYLQLIVKLDGKKVPGKTKKLTGSELLIIEPEYVEWSGDSELYPFVFESIGDWNVETSVAPPEGFVADNKILSEDVNTGLEALQFTITDVGTKWNEPTEITYDIKHKKKKYKIKSKVYQKLKKKKADKLRLDIYGNKIKKMK